MTADIVVGLAAATAASLRWLRVAQREHYLSGSVTRFGIRWWFGLAPNVALFALVVAGVVVALRWWQFGAIASVLAGLGPIGLGVKGRTSALAWTPRLKRVAVAAAITQIVVVVWVGQVAQALIPIVVVLSPVWIDLALAALAPIERRQGDKWVDRAASGLERSGAKVVAITGSYGKTSTKVIAAHLLNGVTSTVASPASFNNRMGLARAINEGLAPGTEVFIAEMGIYGAGEIAELCKWIPPVVGVITAIGPVHLERMKTEEGIAEAKREILERAQVGVLNVDHPLLARIADEEASRIEIIRCGTGEGAVDVRVDGSSGEAMVRGRRIGSFDLSTVHAGNAACAIGIVVGLGFEPSTIADRLTAIPVVPNRQATTIAEGGFTIVDNTFNSNPAGARAALDRLAGIGGRRRVLVTPGMVELGPIQERENRELARYAAAVVTDLVIVGRTNLASLKSGAADAGLGAVIVTSTREEAVAWIRKTLGEGDSVLYENDLPDHFP